MYHRHRLWQRGAHACEVWGSMRLFSLNFRLLPIAQFADVIRTAAFVVSLVVFLRGIEIRSRGNFGRNRSGVCTGGIQLPFFGEGKFVLLGRVVENRAAILDGIDGGRVVDVEENVEKILVSNLRGIEFEVDRFCVSRLPVFDIKIRGISLRSTRVTDAGSDHAGYFSEAGFNTPEAAGGKCGFL